MLNLSAALVALFTSHVGPSSPHVRARLVSVLGWKAFYALYGLISLLVVSWIVLAYREAASPQLWSPPSKARWLAVLVMPIALWLVIARLRQRPGGAPAGIYRVCVAPGSAGFLLWSLLHLMNVGHGAGIALFATFAAISLTALLKNWRGASVACRQAGPIPFVALVRGRQPIVWSEHDAASAFLAVAVWTLLLWLHPLVIGVDPTAGLI